MKKIFIALSIVLFVATTHSLFAAGSVQLSQEYSSSKMNKTMKYSVYLPEGYETSGLAYPVIYLLHGVSGNEQSWIYSGQVPYILDQFYKNTGKQFIVVVPDGGNYWYLNDYQGISPYEDYFVQELMPLVEKKYRIRSERSNRFVAGLSMGGFGSLHFALKYPELFAKCYAMSAGLFTNEEFSKISSERYQKYGLDKLLGNLQGEARMTDLYKNEKISTLILKAEPSKLKTLRFYLDCGDDDFVLFGNLELMKLIREKELNAELRIRDGAHNWKYWTEALQIALPFFVE